MFEDVIKTDHVVVDIESEYWAEHVEGGWSSLDKFGVACGVIYSYIDDSYKVYYKNDIDDLRQRLLQADKITGFNTYKFDYPVIWGMTLKKWLRSSIAKKIIPKTNDLLRRVWLSNNLDPLIYSPSHRGYGLNALALATLGEGKTGVGKEAVNWYANGELGKVANYCMQDVKLTRDLNDFINYYGYVLDGKDQVTRVWVEPGESIIGA